MGSPGWPPTRPLLPWPTPPRPSAERAERALGLLEAGRTILLSQALDTRSDLTDLREQHPHLAARFIDLRDQLDRPADPSDLISTPPAGPATEPHTQQARDRRLLAEDLAATLTQIRTLEGFTSFALPPTTGELLDQAASGPVVVFNISRHRSDALLLTRDGITSLHLPGLTIETVIDQINAFHQALHTTTDPDARREDRIAAQARLRQILGWLWDNAAEPVLRKLGHTSGPECGQDWPRVWWAPGGLLGLLPVHAAGHHTDPPGPEARTVMDRVISSYTPTIRALRHARQHARAQPATPDRALIIAMPTTPGLPDQGRLPNVPAEAAMVQARLPNPVLLTEPGTPGDLLATEDDAATKANVLARLPACSIAHFACHGASHPTDPSQSRLLLHDHQNDPLNVTGLAPITLDHARLAYLSACSTAVTTTTELLDEAIHLTSAFQLAGFPHVIGTLWEINDAIAVEIADTFYTTLTTGNGTPDTDRAAHALHHAIRTARDHYPLTPSLWAAHLHAGA